MKLTILTITLLSVGAVTGFLIAGHRDDHVCPTELALAGCEITARTVSNELNDTRWNLNSCNYQLLKIMKAKQWE